MAGGARLGQAVYFQWPGEPGAYGVVLTVALAVGAFVGIRIRSGSAGFLGTLALIGVLGFGVAKTAVEIVGAPRLASERTYNLSGVVEAVEDRGRRGLRVILRPVAMEPAPRQACRAGSGSPSVTSSPSRCRETA